MKHILITIIIILLFNSHILSKTYFVSTKGNNANSGTFANPWATPGFGSKQLQAGDTLVILGGKYILSTYYDDMITPEASGNESNWITIKGENGNRPILAGMDNLFSAIDISGRDYIRIENLEITSNNGALFREGINGTGGAVNYLILKDIYIHNIDEFGIDIGDVNYMQILNCEISYCGFGAIGGPEGQQGGWRNILIKDCKLSYSGHYYQGIIDNPDNPYDRPDGFGIEASLGPIEIANTIVEHNRGDGLDSKANNTYIHNCIVANNSCDGVKLWGGGSKVENTLIYGIGDGIGGSSPWAGIVIGTTNANSTFEIINTTLHDNYQREAYPMYVQYDNPTVPINLKIKNTIIANGFGLVYIANSVKLTAEYNIFYRYKNDEQVYANGRNYTSSQIEAGELGIGNLCRDPLFISPQWGTTGDYHLQPNSPAIDAGTSGVDIPIYDLEYYPRPQGNKYDIGCYEYHSSSGIKKGEHKNRHTDSFAMRNYPNPFNRITNIEFSLPQEAHYSIKLFDVVGREIHTIMDSCLQPGKHTILFDAKDLPSGVYLYRLQTEEFTETKKLILAK